MFVTEDQFEKLFAALRDKKWKDVEERSRRILRELPSSPGVLYALGEAMLDRGEEFEALRLYRQAISIDRTYMRPYYRLSTAYSVMGWRDEKMRLYRDWSEVEPDNSEVQHFVAAMTGQNVPTRCPEEYVRNLFNWGAASFDDLLVRRLSYRGPEVIAAAFKEHVPNPDATLHVLDAGCGTGLCGPAVRARCRFLVGVDIAEKMIEEARRRECYDELVASEICEFMTSRPESFDVIVSSDVLVYFGSLEHLMAAAATSLRPGGYLILTLEALLDDGSESYRLNTSGRYAHRESYLRDEMAAAGLQVIVIDQSPLRREGDKSIIFYCSVARKKDI